MMHKILGSSDRGVIVCFESSYRNAIGAGASRVGALDCSQELLVGGIQPP
jgi:hypothetical protein